MNKADYIKLKARAAKRHKKNLAMHKKAAIYIEGNYKKELAATEMLKQASEFSIGKALDSNLLSYQEEKPCLYIEVLECMQMLGKYFTCNDIIEKLLIHAPTLEFHPNAVRECIRRLLRRGGDLEIVEKRRKGTPLTIYGKTGWPYRGSKSK